MNNKDFFWRLKISLLTKFLKLKKVFFSTDSLKHLNIKKTFFRIYHGIKPLLKETSFCLDNWKSSKPDGCTRISILFTILTLIFFYVSKSYYFLSNDAFVSFRYVSNAVDGYGFVYNRPPFIPVNGYTSWLWLILLRGMWYIGIIPPHSANLLSFSCSICCLYIAFCFIRRMTITGDLRQHNLIIYLLLCLILLFNKTFLAFFWSGTETALFNLIVLEWTYHATAQNRKPIILSGLSILLAICRLDGIIFSLFTFILLIQGIFRTKKYIAKTIIALMMFGILYLFYIYQEKTYNSGIPNSFIAQYQKNFPDFCSTYLYSIFIEYAYYFWLPFFCGWFGFKILRKKYLSLIFPIELCLFFVCYIIFYACFWGADSVGYKPYSFFTILIPIGMMKIITENITARTRFVIITTLIYLTIGTAIPFSHANQISNITKHKFLIYVPLNAEHIHWNTFFAQKWNSLQKDLISQGAALRLKELQLRHRGLEKSLPSRTTGKQILPEYNRLFIWELVGQVGWIMPYVNIIDKSGQNDIFYAHAPFKSKKTRLLGFEKNLTPGYTSCFNGGGNLIITPFDETPDVKFDVNKNKLTSSIIRGCQDFWINQVGINKKPLKLIDPKKIKHK